MEGHGDRASDQGKDLMRYIFRLEDGVYDGDLVTFSAESPKLTLDFVLDPLAESVIVIEQVASLNSQCGMVGEFHRATLEHWIRETERLFSAKDKMAIGE